MMIAAAVQILEVKNKRYTTITTFIPAALLLYAVFIIEVVLRSNSETKGLGFLKIIIMLCSGYSIALMINGAKKILK